MPSSIWAWRRWQGWKSVPWRLYVVAGHRCGLPAVSGHVDRGGTDGRCSLSGTGE